MKRTITLKALKEVLDTTWRSLIIVNDDNTPEIRIRSQHYQEVFKTFNQVLITKGVIK